MKSKILKILSISSLFLAASCVDLSQEPQSFLTEEEFIKYPQPINIVEKSIDGLYMNMWDSNYGFCCRMLRYNTAAGDVVPQMGKPNNDMIMLYNMTPGTTTVQRDIDALWKNFWTVISNANKIINGTALPEKDKEQYEAVIAEARFMRALNYFYLVRIFGDVPMCTNTSTSVTDAPRASVESIYEKVILPDLMVACEKLPNISRTHTSNSPSKWAAKTLLADVYMTMAGWPLHKGKEYYNKAAETAKEIIDNSNKAGLSLSAKYKDLWLQSKREEANEHLFALHNNLGVNPSQYGKSFIPNDHVPGGWGDYFASEKFMNEYPEGERKDFIFITDWVFRKGEAPKNYRESTNKLPLINKYRDYDVVNSKTGVISQLSNGLTPIYRFADALLIYAECSNLASGQVNDLALKCLNDIQKRAGESVLTTTRDSQKFDEIVLNERRYEFYCENKSWFDMIRREKAQEKRANEWNQSVYKANGHYYLPIPMEQVKMSGWENNIGY